MEVKKYKTKSLNSIIVEAIQWDGKPETGQAIVELTDREGVSASGSYSRIWNNGGEMKLEQFDFVKGRGHFTIQVNDFVIFISPNHCLDFESPEKFKEKYIKL